MIATQVLLGYYELSVPLVCASMHALYTYEANENIRKAGSLFVRPRFNSLNDIATDRDFVDDIAAISVNMATAHLVAAMLPKYAILSIEIANGYITELHETIKRVKKIRPDLYVMAGTVAEETGAIALYEAGANAILVGIGVGSACQTAQNTGVGLPLDVSLQRIASLELECDIVACGGIKTYGEIPICLALGADMVMSGRLFAGCNDVKSKIYYGETSPLNGKTTHIEGTEFVVPQINKSSGDVIREAKEHLQSTMSYVGAYDLMQFSQRVKLEKI